jgi:hypothetical protein
MKVRASGTFRRYVVDAREPDSGAALAKRLHAKRFRSIDHAGSETSSAGWSRPDGTVPREFDADDARLGEILALWLRIDRKALPPGALRVRRMEAEAAERRGVGERIPPARRREIAEKIETELLARAVPATALHSLLWHSRRRELLFDGVAETTNVAFRALFRESFDAALEPLGTAALAARLAPGKGAAKAGEVLPATFVSGAVAVAPDSPAFLGRELLAWLWFRAEHDGGRFELGELGEAGVAFDRLLELGELAEGGKVSVRGDAPTRSPEAASALLSGRLPTRARLLIARGTITFEVTLAGDVLDLESVKVDAVSDAIRDENLRARDEQRANWLFDLAALVDALFAQFLAQRLARDFESTLLADMRRWITTRSRSRARAAVA